MHQKHGANMASKRRAASPLRPIRPAKISAERGEHCLLALPENLLKEILSQLPRSDLVTLKQTNSEIGALAHSILWSNVVLDLHNVVGVTLAQDHIKSDHNANAMTNIVTHTTCLTLRVPGDTRPEVLKTCASLLAALSTAKSLRRLQFVDSQLDTNCWKLLGQMFHLAHGIRKSICEINFPSLTTDGFLAKKLAWNRIDTFEVAPYDSRFVAFLASGWGIHRKFSFSLEGARRTRGHLLLEHQGNLSDLVQTQFQDTVQHGWGTDLTTVREILQSLRVITVFESANITRKGTTVGVLNGIGPGLGSLTPLIFTTSLDLYGIKLGATALDGIALRCLRTLSLRCCDQLPTLLKAFTPNADFSTIVEFNNIKSFTCVNSNTYLNKPSKKTALALEDFLSSFSGLEKLHLHTSGGTARCASIDLDRILQNHSSLESLVLRFGDRDFNLPSFGAVNGHCPNLKVFGFMWSPVKVPLETGSWNQNYMNASRALASNLMVFQSLEEIQIIVKPVEVRDFRINKYGGVCPYHRTMSKLHEHLQAERLFRESLNANDEALSWRPHPMTITGFQLESSPAFNTLPKIRKATVQKRFYYMRSWIGDPPKKDAQGCRSRIRLLTHGKVSQGVGEDSNKCKKADGAKSVEEKEDSAVEGANSCKEGEKKFNKEEAEIKND